MRGTHDLLEDSLMITSTVQYSIFEIYKIRFIFHVKCMCHYEIGLIYKIASFFFFFFFFCITVMCFFFFFFFFALP